MSASYNIAASPPPSVHTSPIQSQSSDTTSTRYYTSASPSAVSLINIFPFKVSEFIPRTITPQPSPPRSLTAWEEALKHNIPSSTSAASRSPSPAERERGKCSDCQVYKKRKLSLSSSPSTLHIERYKEKPSGASISSHIMKPTTNGNGNDRHRPRDSAEVGQIAMQLKSKLTAAAAGLKSPNRQSRLNGKVGCGNGRLGEGRSNSLDSFKHHSTSNNAFPSPISSFSSEAHGGQADVKPTSGNASNTNNSEMSTPSSQPPKKRPWLFVVNPETGEESFVKDTSDQPLSTLRSKVGVKKTKLAKKVHRTLSSSDIVNALQQAPTPEAVQQAQDIVREPVKPEVPKPPPVEKRRRSLPWNTSSSSASSETSSKAESLSRQRLPASGHPEISCQQGSVMSTCSSLNSNAGTKQNSSEMASYAARPAYSNPALFVEDLWANMWKDLWEEASITSRGCRYPMYGAEAGANKISSPTPLRVQQSSSSGSAEAPLSPSDLKTPMTRLELGKDIRGTALGSSSHGSLVQKKLPSRSSLPPTSSSQQQSRNLPWLIHPSPLSQASKQVTAPPTSSRPSFVDMNSSTFSISEANSKSTENTNPASPVPSPKQDKQQQRPKQSSLPLTSQKGAFATAASSRQRRNLTKITPLAPTPRRTSFRESSRSAPGTPTTLAIAGINSPISNKGSPAPSDSGTTQDSPYSRLPPMDNPAGPGVWLSRAPLDVVSKFRGITDSKLGLKGRFRIAVETDDPSMEDFIVVKDFEGNYGTWRNIGQDDDESVLDEDETEDEEFDEPVTANLVNGTVSGLTEASLEEQCAKPVSGSSVKPSQKGKERAIAPRPAFSGIRGMRGGAVKQKKKAKKVRIIKPTSSDGPSISETPTAGPAKPRARPPRRVSLENGVSFHDTMDWDYDIAPPAGSRPMSRAGAASTASTNSIPADPSPNQGLRTRPARQVVQRAQAAGFSYATQFPEFDSPPKQGTVTASSTQDLLSDTDVSSDDDIIPARSLFAYRSAGESTTVQTRSDRTQRRIDAIRKTESGPSGKGLVPGSTSIFSIVQVGSLSGTGVMGPPNGKVTPAELRLYWGRRGDQVPLYGSGGNMVMPGLGSCGKIAQPHMSSNFSTGDGAGGLNSTTQFLQGGIVEVKRVLDPLMEATMEVRRLIFDGGHHAALVEGRGTLGALVVDKVYWSGEREKSLTHPQLGIGLEFSGRPLVKGLTFFNSLTNHTYTLLFTWAFLPVNTPAKNKENAVGNTMLLSDEVKGDGAKDLRAEEIREAFQVHLCVGKPGRVQKKEERKRVVFVQVPTARGSSTAPGGGGRTGKGRIEWDDKTRWERWELDGLMRGLTRLWHESSGECAKLGVARRDKMSLEGEVIGWWLEREVLGLGLSLGELEQRIFGWEPHGSLKQPQLTRSLTESSFLTSSRKGTENVLHSSGAAAVTMALSPQQCQGDLNSIVSPLLHAQQMDTPWPAPTPSTSPRRPSKTLPPLPTITTTVKDDVMRRQLTAKHRKQVLWREMTWGEEDLETFKDDKEFSEDGDDGLERMYWWEV